MASPNLGLKANFARPTRLDDKGTEALKKPQKGTFVFSSYFRRVLRLIDSVLD
jgi:hypothetical protein